MYTFQKQPAEILDYDINLEDWLDGDEVNACTVTAPEGISYDGKNIFTDRVKLWFSGGTDKEQYKITALIVTEMGRTKEVDFKIRVRER